MESAQEILPKGGSGLLGDEQVALGSAAGIILTVQDDYLLQCIS